MLAKTKLASVVVADTAIILAQATEALPLPTNLPGTVLEYGISGISLAILYYIVRLILSGSLVSKSTIEAVVAQSTRIVLDELRKDGVLISEAAISEAAERGTKIAIEAVKREAP